ncbi:MAG: sulfur carrier protein ThiS [Ruminococcus sp.]|nr:sulfur carrier protein ThiS [Ruminococcus sp.]
MVKINGNLTDYDGKNISEILSILNYDPKRVAVEINEEILPKAEYEDTFIKDGDTVEIVSFVGGG